MLAAESIVCMEGEDVAALDVKVVGNSWKSSYERIFEVLGLLGRRSI